MNQKVARHVLFSIPQSFHLTTAHTFSWAQFSNIGNLPSAARLTWNNKLATNSAEQELLEKLTVAQLVVKIPII
jgi:hypothetical protein